MKKTREEWLRNSIEEMRDTLFKPINYKLPSVRASVGFPYGSKGTTKIGQCWAPTASGDGNTEIFIHPALKQPEIVLSTLVHELAHASVGCDKGHGPVFKRCALALDLVGPMRATSAGVYLKEYLADLIKKLGAYPHGGLNVGQSPVKKQTTRMIKMACHEDGYICRASATTIETFGTTICPICENHMEVSVNNYGLPRK